MRRHAFLAHREPRLLDVEQAVRAGCLRSSAPLIGPKGLLARLDSRLPLEERRDAEKTRATYATVKAIRDELKMLVGPSSDPRNPLLQSEVAAPLQGSDLIAVGG